MIVARKTVMALEPIVLNGDSAAITHSKELTVRARIFHEATRDFCFYLFIYQACSELMIKTKMTECLFNARANSASHLTRPPGAWRAKRQGDLCSSTRRRILMNNAS